MAKKQKIKEDKPQITKKEKEQKKMAKFGFIQMFFDFYAAPVT